jgi:hypothetical protein
MSANAETYREEEERLSKVAPVLFKLKKNEGWSTPADYFEELERQVLQQQFPADDGFTTPEGYEKSLEEKLLQITDTVPAASSGFRAPDENYFDSLESRILAETTARANAEGETKVRPLFRRFVIATAAAAAILFFVFGPFEFTQQKECKTFSCLLEEAQLTEEELLLLYEDELIEELLPEETSFEEVIDDDEAVLDYLMKSDLEVYELYDDETL